LAFVLMVDKPPVGGVFIRWTLLLHLPSSELFVARSVQ
jgi:hypothetical protein